MIEEALEPDPVTGLPPAIYSFALDLPTVCLECRKPMREGATAVCIGSTRDKYGRYLYCETCWKDATST